MAQGNSNKKTEKTVAIDSLTESIDQIFTNEIKSGKFFDKRFEEHVRWFSPDMILKLMDKIDSYDLITLIEDFGLKKYEGKINEWLNDYKKFRTLQKLANKQLTIHSTTAEQVILYYYLIQLGIINEDALSRLLPAANQRSILLSYLFNKSEDNVRLALRDVNIKGKDDKYFTNATLQKLLNLSKQIKCTDLEEMVNKDIRKRTK